MTTQSRWAVVALAAGAWFGLTLLALGEMAAGGGVGVGVVLVGVATVALGLALRAALQAQREWTHARRRRPDLEGPG